MFMYVHFNSTHGENRYEELQNVFVHVNERVPIFFVFVFFSFKREVLVQRERTDSQVPQEQE